MLAFRMQPENETFFFSLVITLYKVPQCLLFNPPPRPSTSTLIRGAQRRPLRDVGCRHLHAEMRKNLNPPRPLPPPPSPADCQYDPCDPSTLQLHPNHGWTAFGTQYPTRNDTRQGKAGNPPSSCDHYPLHPFLHECRDLLRYCRRNDQKLFS